MNTAIEARSLSSLTSLAADPPLNPSKPRTEKHDPLVLYIVRVPGSKDVFLTPLKPKEKVVSAEDVHSSLYYLHVNGPDDMRFLEDENEDRPVSPFLEPQESAPPLPPRRPQNSRHYLTDNAIAGASSNFPHHNVRTQSHSARTSSPTVTITSYGQFESKHLPHLPRLPAGGPGLSLRPSAVNGAVVSRDHTPSQLPRRKPLPGHENQRPRESTENVPSEAPPPYSAAVPEHPQTSVTASAASRSSTDATHEPGINLTLIRRDPSSGEQWNVAKIVDPAVTSISSIDTSPQKKLTGQPIYIDVTNPGYDKFRNDQNSLSHTTARPSGNISTGVSFHCELRMERAKFKDDITKSWKSKSPSNTPSQEHSDPMDSLGRRSEEASTRSSFSSLRRQASGGSYPHEANQTMSRSKRYAFKTPWNSWCEFSSGLGTSSLKCKHGFPSNRLGSHAPGAVTVSELRFNLPAASTRPRSSPRSKSESNTKRSRLFSRPHSMQMPRPQAIRQDSELDGDGLDLSLGQERAGGGFGGKQAKLGKLIVEAEGIDMLDVLVAANLGLWWRAYEKD